MKACISVDKTSGPPQDIITSCISVILIITNHPYSINDKLLFHFCKIQGNA